METRFENRIVLTQNLFYEFTRGMFRKTTLFMYAAGVLLLITSMVSFLTEEFAGFIFALIFGVFSLLVYPRILFRTARRSYKQQLLCSSGKDLEKTTEFAERIHIVSSNKAESFFDYPQITQICETKNLLILKITRSLGIVLDQEGFTTGSLAAFRAFIQQKCPHAKYVVHRKIGKTRVSPPVASVSVNPDKRTDENKSENSSSSTPINPGTKGKQSVPVSVMQAYTSAGFRDPALAFPANPHPAMRVFMILLFILSFASIYIALFLISSRQTFSTSLTENNWMFFLPLPIPLANLILGIYYKHRGMKTTKNIVAGVIFTLLLCLAGAVSLTDKTDAYSHDMSYLDAVASEIHFSLPDKGKITKMNFQPDSRESQVESQAGADAFDYDSMSNITFDDSKQTAAFEASLRGSDLWVSSIATPVSGVVPELYSLRADKSLGFDRFMVYNVDLGTYNTLPDRSGTYRFIYLAYGSKEKKMLIGEYSCSVVLK